MTDETNHRSPVAKTKRRLGSRFSVAVWQVALLVLTLTMLRIVLLIQFQPPMVSAGMLVRGLANGLHLDLLVGMVATLPLVLWLALLSDGAYRSRWQRALLTVYFVLMGGLQLFLAFVEYYFFEEFKSRFNTVAVDYVLYPYEVILNIWQSYPLVSIILVCLAFGLFAGWVARWLMRQSSLTPSLAGARWRTAGLAGLGTGLLALTVSFNAPRFSPERTLNEMGGNGQLSFLNAALTRHLDYGAFYRTLPREEAWQRARRLVAGPGETFAGGDYTLQRQVPGDPARPRLNLVLFLEESLGSQFWGILGGGYAGLTNTHTPCLDKLAGEEGLLFTNLFASGNRTVRGLEGVLSSFPPLPGDSIVVRQQSEHVETVGRILKRDGYETVFLYGGRSLFDNMGVFALNNGFDRCVEQKDFPHPVFTTAWGVCDEDLFDRLLAECRALHQTGKPFLAASLSVSNHKPYTYPRGRIAEDPDKHWRHHAVKYADYALGRFFEQARKEPFFTNTIFAVVADHGARVYGSQSIPIESYKIPLLVVGPAVVTHPVLHGALGCSLDVSPTLLGLLGRPYETTFIGRDLLRTGPAEQRVLTHHNRDIGMFRNDRMVVLGLQRSVEYYHGRPATMAHPSKMDRIEEEDLELERDAVALFQVADELYMNRRYRVIPSGAR